MTLRNLFHRPHPQGAEKVKFWAENVFLLPGTSSGSKRFHLLPGTSNVDTPSSS